MSQQFKTAVVAAVVLSGMAASVSCAVFQNNTRDDGQIATPTAQVSEGDPVVPSIHGDHPLARSVEELIEAADVIVMGRSEGVVGITNTAKNPDNPSEPHPEVFGLGRIYQITVDEYLKSTGPNTFNLVQFEGYFVMARESTEIQANPSLKETGPSIEEIKDGTSYVFFLRQRPSDPTMYVPVLDPYRFALIDGIARPEGNFTDSSTALPERDGEELLSQIRNRD